MIGLIAWCRAFDYDKNGQMVRNADGTPARIAYPPSNLWNFIEANAKELATSFDLIQLPPASLAQGGTGPGVDGYEVFEYRNYNGTHWGNEQELVAAIESCHAAGMLVAMDTSFHQQGGENGGPGVFKYDGRPGETTPGWFQGGWGNDDPIPPFVKQDDIPDTQGDYPFGRVRSYQNSIPHGVVEADSIDVLAGMVKIFEPDWFRFDEAKATHQPFVKRLMDSQPGSPFYAEFFTGSASELDWWVRTMGYRSAVADFDFYWHIQNACNQYNGELFAQGGYWQWNSYLSVGFVNNPDTATSWSPTGGISQQIAFNLLLAYALSMFLPFRMFLVFSEDYYSASLDYPTGRGLKFFLDNMCWFAKHYSYGAYEQRWIDKDVVCYTRDGNGGVVGQSGGCLIAVNFNTYNERTIRVQTPWWGGRKVHNYAATGRNEDYIVEPYGWLTITLRANAWSAGQSYYLIA